MVSWCVPPMVSWVTFLDTWVLCGWGGMSMGEFSPGCLGPHRCPPMISWWDPMVSYWDHMISWWEPMVSWWMLVVIWVP